eukprot:CAMPEP_0185210694 /NCGR_PEP_ID=MMETSP1140-20130426/66087_1 /TAXON_ID=298111 /ORGANISM="Pavlova sp., Strain CCMP459" /LENGTH=102 /DNA_ID=CAMNT_0027778515 /DNA_START=310 /DNA_END=614 /DNA_ORIENTATION=+
MPPGCPVPPCSALASSTSLCHASLAARASATPSSGAPAARAPSSKVASSARLNATTSASTEPGVAAGTAKLTKTAGGGTAPPDSVPAYISPVADGCSFPTAP